MYLSVGSSFVGDIWELAWNTAQKFVTTLIARYIPNYYAYIPTFIVGLMGIFITAILIKIVMGVFSK